MDINAITTETILETLGIDIVKGLPKRGKYPCYLSFYKCDIENYSDNLFEFKVEFEFPRGLCIEIPNATIEEIINNDLKFHKDLYTFLLDFIHHNCNGSENYPDGLVMVCFSVLHEFGHWEFFIDSNLTLEEYMEKDMPYRERNRALKGTEREKFMDYRNIPSEKAADEFALKMLIDLMKALLS